MKLDRVHIIIKNEEYDIQIIAYYYVRNNLVVLYDYEFADFANDVYDFCEYEEHAEEYNIPIQVFEELIKEAEQYKSKLREFSNI